MRHRQSQLNFSLFTYATSLVNKNYIRHFSLWSRYIFRSFYEHKGRFQYLYNDSILTKFHKKIQFFEIQMCENSIIFINDLN